MRRVAAVLFCSCVLALAVLDGRAKAGGHGTNYVWYSSGCGYHRDVRHQRTVRFVPVDGYQAHYVHYAHQYVHVGRSARYRAVHFSEFDYYSNFGAPRCHWQEAPLHDGLSPPNLGPEGGLQLSAGARCASARRGNMA